MACLDTINRLDKEKRTTDKSLVNRASVAELSILWEDRLVTELNADAQRFLQFKKSNCSFTPDTLARIRNNFIAWYMLVHPREDSDLQQAFTREIEEHKAKLKDGTNVEHAKRVLALSDELDEIRKPCIQPPPAQQSAINSTIKSRH